MSLYCFKNKCENFYENLGLDTDIKLTGPIQKKSTFAVPNPVFSMQLQEDKLKTGAY